jgi:uncharacterized membrane protein YidH (DUF202 family)
VVGMTPLYWMALIILVFGVFLAQTHCRNPGYGDVRVSNFKSLILTLEARGRIPKVYFEQWREITEIDFHKSAADERRRAKIEMMMATLRTRLWFAISSLTLLASAFLLLEFASYYSEAVKTNFTLVLGLIGFFIVVFVLILAIAAIRINNSKKALNSLYPFDNEFADAYAAILTRVSGHSPILNPYITLENLIIEVDVDLRLLVMEIREIFTAIGLKLSNTDRIEELGIAVHSLKSLFEAYKSFGLTGYALLDEYFGAD